MIKIRDAAGRAGETGIWSGWLLRAFAIRFRDEQVGGASLALWARRAAGGALIAFGLAVLISNFVGGT